MAEKVDPQKHCASITDAGQRSSCEVLAQECNVQQGANASTFTLTGADNRKRTYRSLTACHKAALSLPKELGPLPASRLPAAPVAQLPPDYAPCTITGTEGTPKNTACRHMVDICDTTPQMPIVLRTNQGDITAADRSACRSLAAGLADAGAVSTQPRPSRTQAALPQQPPPQPQTQSQSKPQPKPQPGKGGTAANATTDTHTSSSQQDPRVFAASCTVAGPEGSPKNNACQALVATCATSATGPYTIKTNQGEITATDQPTCVSIATGLADSGLLPAGGMPPSAQPQSGSAQQPASPVQPSTPGGANPQPDAGPRQVKSFADINLRLRVTGENTTEERRTLLFGAIQGVPIRIRYALSRLPDNRFRMQYAIYVQDETTPLGGEQTIEFSSAGNRVNLGFELSLWNEGNYKPIRGIRIINLN